MFRSLLPKFIIIFFVLLFSGILLYPTVGPKTMVVELSTGAEQARIETIISTYQKEGFEIIVRKEPLKIAGSKHQERTVLEFSSFRITLALANALRIYPEVENIRMTSSWIEKFLLAKQIKLGLDLQGGMHLLLQADYQDVIRKLKEDKIATWKKENYDSKGKEPKTKGGPTVDDVLVLEPGLTETEKAQRLDQWKKDRQTTSQPSEAFQKLIEADKKNKVNKGEPLPKTPKTEKTVREPIVLELSEDDVKKTKEQVIVQAREILNKRIDKTGVSEPSIRVVGSDSIEIQLPGIPNPKQAKQMIGSTGMVTYKIVDRPATDELAKKIKDIPTTPLTDKEYTELRDKSLSLLASKKSKSGKALEVVFLFRKNKEGKYIAVDPYVMESDVRLQGDDIDKAWVGSTDESINAVHFQLTANGADKFADLTGASKGRQLGVIIDNRLYSGPPSIRDKIAGGRAYISGDFTKEEADTLASIINEGALPVKLSIIEERTVGPSLGIESIESGLQAVVLAFGLVIIIMFFRYKASGLIATFGLFSNFLMLGALLSWLGATLTLPGIAGLILTLGMAVDANVIIFERIREELRNGKSVRVAISGGFDKAFSTILDSNLTTLIAALVLSRLGTGPIKGFAVTLSVGIVSSMFAALYISRFIFDLIAARKNLSKLSI